MDISDVELRRRLVAQGFDPPPVTDSSRGVLVKKLIKLESNSSSSSSVSVNCSTPHNRSTRNSKNWESNDFKGFDDSSVRQIRNLVKNSSNRTSPSPSPAQQVHDPFEKGSDSDDSILCNSRIARASTLARKPLETRRENNYLANLVPSKKYKIGNGAGSFSNRSSRSRFKNLKLMFAKLFPFSTSSTLLGVFALFFVIVGVIYFFKNDYTYGELSTVNINQPACSVHGRVGTSCVRDDQMEEALKCARILYRTLWKREKDAICGDAKGPVVLNGDELMEILSRELDMLSFEADRATKNVRTLVNANPDLKITWSQKENGFRLYDVQIPWSCSFKLWFYVICEYTWYVVWMLALLGSMHLVYRWVVQRYEDRKRGKQELIKDIVELLHQNALANPKQAYLPIVHIRDQLIPYADRDRKKKMWEEAVKYVEENESRIRKEVQPLKGEDYDVWRWVGVPKQSSSLKPKIWHGEAFDTSKDTINVPATSPTPCLKIRNMFNPKNETSDRDWTTRIADAILERCEGVDIVHIMVDEANTEGCVYMKCASTEDAGKAYRKMHGAWYDGQIVSVKYLRAERYHERFPSSVNMRKPLLPSNDQKRSLA